MTQPETWTVGRLLAWTADYLKKSGSPSARLDAEVLLSAARKCERIALYTAFEEIVLDDVRSTFRDLVKRRAGGTPVAYLVGKKEFYSLSFLVTPDVLIPRPETEHLVVAAVDLLAALPAGSHPLVADVGTGSGAIAVCLAKHTAHAKIVATDISPAALAVARQNAASHGVSERIDFLETDMLEKAPAERKFDLVVSNPPYIGLNEEATLAPQVRDHEPRVALFAGPDGTEIIARLIPQAAARLKAGGYLLMEVSPLIAAGVSELVQKSNAFEPATILKDLAGLARVVQARRIS
ncbi:MAG: peptide chain release factor N(5)-glutamine methyltransferase [Planctomycetales bacterium]|nr:peptide chain release factor N(5)-glutamine methyltransferase [Planctomycetales bacterium]